MDRRSGSFVAVVSFSTCFSTCLGRPNASPPLPVEVIDLSLTISEDLPVRFWGRKMLKDFGFTETTDFRHVVNEKPTYVRNSYLTIFNHGGPHIDGPNHLERGAKGVDAFPLDKFVGPLRLLTFVRGRKTRC